MRCSCARPNRVLPSSLAFTIHGSCPNSPGEPQGRSAGRIPQRKVIIDNKWRQGFLLGAASAGFGLLVSLTWIGFIPCSKSLSSAHPLRRTINPKEK